jgi:hypothetical protein
MPKVLEWKGYKFFFYSNEGNPREPCHVHVRKGEKTAKFWMSPRVELGLSYEMSSKELALLQEVVEKNAGLIRRRWDEFFRA